MIDVNLPTVSSVRGSLARPHDVLDPRITSIAVPIAPPAAGESEVQPRRGVADLAALYRIDLADLAAREGLKGNVGEVKTIVIPRVITHDEGGPEWDSLPGRIQLVGVGDETPKALRRAGAALARAAQPGDRIATTIAADAPAESSRAFVEGFLLGTYRGPRYSEAEADAGVAELLLIGRHNPAALSNALIGVEATIVARDLAATPSNIKSPQWMVEQVRRAVSGLRNVTVTAMGERRLAAEGFGGVLAVGSGSSYESRFVLVDYTPEVQGRHIALVGKGITYDTGGLSIKPREAMVPMKTDMAGAAVVLAAVVAAARQELSHRVTALLPLAENAFGGASYRPGDIITTYGGRTVEIANTDAEGRVVLADALAYADEVLDPDLVIDVATLTGAASLGLGKQYGALYANDDRLAEALTAASGLAGEPLWRMPLVEDYMPAIESKVADLRHVPQSNALGAGSVTAALFLREFVGARRWAHLDIAGPGRAPKDHLEISEGATGFGARLLVRYLEALR